MKIKSLVGVGLLLGLNGIMSGCGLDHSDPPTTQITQKGQSGKITQGPVYKATVWADSLDGGIRMVIDDAEKATQTETDINGNFVLPVQPNYKYVIVSQGGTDQITLQPATTMMAPAGSKTCSPLTTVVALAPAAQQATLIANINAMLPPGKTFADDLSAASSMTPAALLLVKSIETTVATLNKTIVNASGSTTAISTTQQNFNQLETYSNIATQLSTMTSAQMGTPSNLSTSLTAAVQTSITTIANVSNTDNVGLSTTNNNAAHDIAVAVATNAVASSAQVVGAATGDATLKSVTVANVATTATPVATNSNLTESTAMAAINTVTNQSGITATTNAVTQTATAQQPNVTASTTVANYVPPQVIVVAANPTIVGYALSATPSNSNWTVTRSTITFSDAMNAVASTDANFGTSVLNPANVSGGGCTPASYADKVLTLSCPAVASGATLTWTVKGAVKNSALTSTLLVDNTKAFVFPVISLTGSGSGSSSINF